MVLNSDSQRRCKSSHRASISEKFCRSNSVSHEGASEKEQVEYRQLNREELPPLFFAVFVTAGSWRELNVLNSGLAHVTHLSATPLRQGCSSHFNPVTHFQDTGEGGAKRPVDVTEDWITAVTLQSTTWSGEAPKSSAVHAAAAGEPLSYSGLIE